MNSKIAKLALFALALVLILSPAARAQDGEPVVIDEVVAMVNNEVITLSMVKREMKEAVLALVQQGQTEQQATEEVVRRQPEMIASLVNEQLLLQQGKELGLADEVEAEVNRRMLDVAKQQGIKTIEELRKAMQANGFDYDAVRQTMRTEMMKQAVFSRDVDARIFWGLSNDELKSYYEAHREQFKKPESVKLSEIFLSLAGKSEAEVKAKIDELLAQARGGANFGVLAATHSERQQDGKRTAPETKGEVGLFEVTNLRENIATAIKDVKAGGVSDPIRYDEGYQILRVDERIAGSATPTFNDTRVREVITAERGEKERKAYMEKLRSNALIKFSETYRAAVLPFLAPSAAPAASTTTPAVSTNTPVTTTAEKKATKKGSQP